MITNLTKLIIYVIIAILSIWLNTIFKVPYGQNIQNSIIALIAVHIVFKILIEFIGNQQIHGYKERYSFNRFISITYASIYILILFSIWAQSVQALFVAYGLVAAGVALALQDVFKNLAGGLLLIIRGIYRVGNRIQIDNIHGDVIDISIFSTTILEINNWVDGDQTTGRLINIPNGYILAKPVYNYTKDNLIVWDEIMIPLTHQSNLQIAEKEITNLTNKITKKYQEQAEHEISKLSSKYYLEPRDAKPSTYIKITDNWIELSTRYVTLARERRNTKNLVNKKIISLIKKHQNIHIATSSIKVI